MAPEKNLEKFSSQETPNQQEAPEKKTETKSEELSAESQEKQKEAQEAIETEKKTNKEPAKNKIKTAEEERKEKIDQILSEGLSDTFLSLSPQRKKRFKEEGERTREKINELLGEGRVKIKKIIFLIKKWLGIIPRANKYYLEQEAKIKAEKIIRLKKQ